MNFKAHHVSLTVKNLKESIKWYQDIFNCRLIHEYHSGEWNIALLSLDNFYIELIQSGKPLSLPSYRKNIMTDIKTVGTKHVCFQVNNLEETIKNLKKRSLKIATNVDTAAFGGKFVFIKDCNGILIELYQAGESV